MKHTAPKFTKNKIKCFGKALCRKLRDYEVDWNIHFVETIDELDSSEKLPQILYDSIGVIAGSEDLYNEIKNATDEIKRDKIIGFIFTRASIWKHRERGGGNEEVSDDEDDEN